MGITLLRFAFFSLTLLLAAAACSGGADSGSASCVTPVEKKSYLMAFHYCDGAASDCSNPASHMIALAGSDDGLSFSLVDAFSPRAGSVPDIVFHEGYLYLFHTQGAERWVKLDACMKAAASGGLSIDGAADSFVDPSVLSIGGKLVMFYLPGAIGMDPAGCQSYPCLKEIRSAEVAGSDPSGMKSVSGARASLNISNGTFSDPDVLGKNGGGYLLYVSAGQSVYAFQGGEPTGTFESPRGASYFISENQGGVPSALQAGDGSIWLYVATNSSGRETIRRGISQDGTTPIPAGSFTAVLDGASLPGFSSSTSVSSPSIVRWE